MSQNTRLGSGFILLPLSVLALVVGLVIMVLAIGSAPYGAVARVEVTPIGIATNEAATAVAALPTAAPTAAAPEAAAEGVTQPVVFDERIVEQGRSLFQTSCAGCHASNARGIPGLGKDLVASDFVRGLNDTDLAQFITVGRQPFDPANTTGIIMPARGGNPALSDPQIQEIVTYLRSESQTVMGSAYLPGVEIGSVPEAVAAIPVDAAHINNVPEVAPQLNPDFVLPITALGFDDANVPAPLPEAEIDPAKAYALSCAGCHGLAGEGAAGFGPAITDANDAEAIYALLTNNQPPISPLEGFPHPTRAEYPALTDNQLRALVDYAVALGG